LYVSNIEPYKSQLEVIDAFRLLKNSSHEHLKLLLVGPESARWYAKLLRERANELGLATDVVFTGRLPHAALPAVYANALVGVFNSECENCPNALLEAMAAGVPMVVSDRPPMPEFAQDAAVYVDPRDSADIARGINELLTDGKRRNVLGAAARAKSCEYRWPETIGDTWKAILSVAKDPQVKGSAGHA